MYWDVKVKYTEEGKDEDTFFSKKSINNEYQFQLNLCDIRSSISNSLYCFINTCIIYKALVVQYNIDFFIKV